MGKDNFLKRANYFHLSRHGEQLLGLKQCHCLSPTRLEKRKHDAFSFYTQGEIRCFRNSEMLRKPDGSKFRHVSAGRLRRETCKMKMEALFRVSGALPLT